MYWALYRGIRMPKLSQLKSLIFQLYLLSRELDKEELVVTSALLKPVRARRVRQKIIDKPVDKPKLLIIQGGKARLDVED